MGEVFAYFLRLGGTVFGGVGPQLLAMRRDLVEDRKWVTPREFERGVALAYMCPGPVGTQAGVYMGWRRAGAAGATAALAGFLTIPFLLVVALAAAHAHYGSGGAFGRLVWGMRCAVVPVIALSAVKLFRSALAGRLERGAAILALIWCVFRPADATAAVLASGLVLAFLASRGTDSRGAVAATLPAVFLVGLQAGALVYGTGQAILPIVREAAVVRRAWLTDAQFADAISAGLVTPGPIVMAIAYVGFIAAGFGGALAAAIGAFLPGWALVLLVGPWMEKLERDPRLKAFSRGATAAAIGAVGAAAAALAGTTLGAPKSALVAAASAAAVLLGAPDAAVIAACGAAAALMP
jgi:chromate transporter